MSDVAKSPVRVYCRQCHKEGNAEIVVLDSLRKTTTMRCPNCRSLNVKVVGLDAPEGEHLGKMSYPGGQNDNR